MAKLLSVNVGLPREISWQARVVRTAIRMRPVTGRVLARRLNLDGAITSEVRPDWDLSAPGSAMHGMRAIGRRFMGGTRKE